MPTAQAGGTRTTVESEMRMRSDTDVPIPDTPMMGQIQLDSSGRSMNGTVAIAIANSA